MCDVAKTEKNNTAYEVSPLRVQ